MTNVPQQITEGIDITLHSSMQMRPYQVIFNGRMLYTSEDSWLTVDERRSATLLNENGEVDDEDSINLEARIERTNAGGEVGPIADLLGNRVRRARDSFVPGASTMDLGDTAGNTLPASPIMEALQASAITITTAASSSTATTVTVAPSTIAAGPSKPRKKLFLSANQESKWSGFKPLWGPRSTKPQPQPPLCQERASLTSTIATICRGIPGMGIDLNGIRPRPQSRAQELADRELARRPQDEEDIRRTLTANQDVDMGRLVGSNQDNYDDLFTYFVDHHSDEDVATEKDPSAVDLEDCPPNLPPNTLGNNDLEVDQNVDPLSDDGDQSSTSESSENDAGNTWRRTLKLQNKPPGAPKDWGIDLTSLKARRRQHMTRLKQADRLNKDRRVIVFKNGQIVTVKVPKKERPIGLGDRRLYARVLQSKRHTYQLQVSGGVLTRWYHARDIAAVERPLAKHMDRHIGHEGKSITMSVAASRDWRRLFRTLSQRRTRLWSTRRRS